MMSPPRRYVDDKAARMMFPPPARNVRSLPSSSPNQPRGPPVPPKEDDYQGNPTKGWDRRTHGKGIRVQKGWDIERGVGEDSDWQPLDPTRGYSSRR